MGEAGVALAFDRTSHANVVEEPKEPGRKVLLSENQVRRYAADFILLYADIDEGDKGTLAKLPVDPLVLLASTASIQFGLNDSQVNELLNYCSGAFHAARSVLEAVHWAVMTQPNPERLFEEPPFTLALRFRELNNYNEMTSIEDAIHAYMRVLLQDSYRDYQHIIDTTLDTILSQ